MKSPATPWRNAAARTHARLAFVVLALDDAFEHRRRVTGRVRDLRHLPEPTWDEVRQRAATYAPWDADCVLVSAADPVDQVARAVLDQLPS